jgi:hypothetical protein
MREEILQDLLQLLASQLKDDSTTSWQVSLAFWLSAYLLRCSY